MTPVEWPATLVSRAWVEDVLHRAVPAGVNWFLLDRAEYHVLSRTDFQMLVGWDWTNQVPYIPDRRDCDKFAVHFWDILRWRLGVNGVGWVVDWTSAHSYNLIIFDDGTWEWWEPQNDTPVQLATEGLYQLRSGFVYV